ncbi:MAG: HD domain-containing protein [Firmicutes bacterium]|nr:HD domain-containing protein [Bacillota bacterium]
MTRLFADSEAQLLGKLGQVLAPDHGLALVGGAVRDALLERPLGDWDLATALRPEEVMTRARQGGFSVIPTGLQHGTVMVMLEGRPVEITSYRGDGDYRDGRRPEVVRFGVTLEEDLARRDFTVNAMALPLEAANDPDWATRLVDPWGGRADLEARLLRAVGDPLQRFAEDGLRPLRACRFAAQLDFEVEAGTLAAIPPRLDVARKVAVERVFQEMTKLLCGQAPARGLRLLERTGLLDLWLAELGPMVGCLQNRHHRFDVWEHTLAVIEALPADPAMRWAGLLHDAGKPMSVSVDAKGERHFYNHETRSGDLAEALLSRLRSSRALIQEVLALVRHHGQHPDPAWSDAACRRFLTRLKRDELPLARWAAFRRGDLLGKGFDRAEALALHERMVTRLETLQARFTAWTAKDLALDGHALAALAQRSPGPWLGRLQGFLLEQVLEDPHLNTPEALARLVGEWGRE